MNRNTVGRRPYVRPTRGWWRRDPYFVRYMVREATALAVGAYAIVLAFGVVSLSRGEAAWNGWLAALRMPWALLLHGVLLFAMLVHTKSWFEIMPKTMPMLFVRGRRLADSTITRAGWAAAIVVSAALYWFARWWRP